MDEKPLRLSWSRLRSHAECPAKGQLLSQGYKAKGSDIRMFFHGTVVDSAMRQWLAMENPPLGWMLERVDQILDEEETKARETGDGIVRWRNVQDKEEVRAFCRELVTRLETLLAVICLPYGWQEARRFTVPMTIPGLDGQPRRIDLTGEIDLLTMPPQGVVVWDLKATKDSGYWRKVLGQLIFYEIAVFIMKGAWPVRSALIQPMCEQQIVPFQITEDQRREMLTRIVRTAHDIWQGNTLPKADSVGCQGCFVRHACPKYKVAGGRGRVVMPGSVPVIHLGG